MTDDTKRGIHIFAWQYDNQHILYAQDADGDENWRLYQTDIATRQTRNLTPFDKVQASIVAYEWHKPGMLLVQINQRDESLFDVYRLDLATGELEMDTENPGDVASWHADNDLQVRAAQVMTADGSTIIRVRNDANSPWRDLMQWGAGRDLRRRLWLYAGQSEALGCYQHRGERGAPVGSRHRDRRAERDRRRSAVRYLRHGA